MTSGFPWDVGMWGSQSTGLGEDTHEDSHYSESSADWWLRNIPLVSQSHRMVEVVRDLWRPSGPTPCSGRATYNQLPRLCPFGFWRTLRRETSSSMVGDRCHRARGSLFLRQAVNPLFYFARALQCHLHAVLPKLREMGPAKYKIICC